MSQIVGDNENNCFYVPCLALNFQKELYSFHFCLFWLENLSFYGRRHSNRNDSAVYEQSSSTFSAKSNPEACSWWYHELAT